MQCRNPPPPYPETSFTYSPHNDYLSSHRLSDEFAADPRHHLHDAYERAAAHSQHAPPPARPASALMNGAYNRRYPPLPKLRRAVRHPAEDIRNCANNPPIPYHQRNNLDAFDPDTFPLDNPSLQHISDTANGYRQSYVPSPTGDESTLQQPSGSSRHVTVRNASTSTPPDLTLFPSAVAAAAGSAEAATNGGLAARKRSASRLAVQDNNPSANAEENTPNPPKLARQSGSSKSLAAAAAASSSLAASESIDLTETTSSSSISSNSSTENSSDSSNNNTSSKTAKEPAKISSQESSQDTDKRSSKSGVKPSSSKQSTKAKNGGGSTSNEKSDNNTSEDKSTSSNEISEDVVSLDSLDIQTDSGSNQELQSDNKEQDESKNNNDNVRKGGKRRSKRYKSSLAIAASTLAPSQGPSRMTRSRSSLDSGSQLMASSSSSSSSSGASTPSAGTPAAAYSQEALRDLVCSTLAPAAAANLIKSDKREEKKRKSQSSEPVAAAASSSSAAEPQPGPSGLQNRQSSAASSSSGSSNNNVLAAPDLQLDCLSSDSDTDAISSDEDIKIVKISRKNKGKSLAGSAAKVLPVEVDLTVENTTDDEITVEEVTVNASKKVQVQVTLLSLTER